MLTKDNLEKSDSDGMYNVYDKWPHIARDAYDSDLESVDFKDIDNVVFSGMGGSGAIGDLFHQYYQKAMFTLQW